MVVHTTDNGLDSYSKKMITFNKHKWDCYFMVVSKLTSIIIKK